MELICCHCEFCKSLPINWSDCWAFGTMFFTALLGLIAYFQLGASNKTKKADFAHRLKNDFFTPETSQLVMLLQSELIEFVEEKSADKNLDLINDFVHFKVNVNEVQKLKRKLTGNENAIIEKYYYTDYEIDDLLLGHFEDIGIFLKQRSLDMETAFELFGWYIIAMWENKEVQKYIIWVRKNLEDGNGVYERFEEMYPLMKERMGRLKNRLNYNGKINDFT